RDPDRSQRLLVRVPTGGPTRGLADRGLPFGQVPGRHRAARGRSVRRRPREGVSVVTVLAVPLNNDTVTPGAICLGVVVLMGVALFFLLRSMNRQIGKIQAPKEADLRQAE